MDDLLEHVVSQGDNGQYVISKEQLLTMRTGGWNELQAAIFKFATENPHYTIAVESLIGGMIDGAVRITWRKNG